MSHTKSNSLMFNESSKIIIAAIDSLKSRKARPDELKICNYVERKFGANKADIIKAIDEAVNDGSVLKVRYKDSVSFRNASNFSKTLNNHVMPFDDHYKPQVIKRVLRELRALTRFNSVNGVSAKNLLNSLHNRSQLLFFNESHVIKVLNRAIQSDSVKQLENGNYIICGQRIVPRKGDPDQSVYHYNNFRNEEIIDKMVNKEKEIDLFEGSSITSDTTSSNHSFTSQLSMNAKKAIPVIKRPISRRKKFKKSHGPDFLEASQLQYLSDSFEPKCDFCQLNNVPNKNEEYIVCKNCNATAHPFCAKYNKNFNERLWQCIKCKTCVYCNNTGKDYMLVCYVCGEGYHMNCMTPPIKQKPIGNWICDTCKNITESETQEKFSISLADMKDDKQMNIISDENNLKNTTHLNAKQVIGKYPQIVPNPQKWTSDDVENFISSIGFPEQSQLFKEQEIDGLSLLLLRRSDILTGFQMKLGPALKIYSHIIRLQEFK